MNSERVVKCCLAAPLTGHFPSANACSQATKCPASGVAELILKILNLISDPMRLRPELPPKREILALETSLQIHRTDANPPIRASDFYDIGLMTHE